MMRTANPALSEKVFRGFGSVAETSSAMTIQGTVNKTLALLFLLMITAGWVWVRLFTEKNVEAVVPWMIAGVIGGLVAALVTVFKKQWAMVTAPIYALMEGLAIGGISAFAEMQFKGIVLQAVALTFGTLLCLLIAYKSRVIKVTENFKLGVFAATGAVGLIYLATFVLGMFGVRVPYIHESGMIGIGISIAIVVIAALNLVLDFDFIEQGAQQAAPKYMEWYAAFGLMVTLVWLYIEILRLLSKMGSRR